LTEEVDDEEDEDEDDDSTDEVEEPTDVEMAEDEVRGGGARYTAERPESVYGEKPSHHQNNTCQKRGREKTKNRGIFHQLVEFSIAHKRVAVVVGCQGKYNKVKKMKIRREIEKEQEKSWTFGINLFNGAF
jgi:hypothetical protein